MTEPLLPRRSSACPVWGLQEREQEVPQVFVLDLQADHVVAEGELAQVLVDVGAGAEVSP
jgi:hypothetical protein